MKIVFHELQSNIYDIQEDILYRIEQNLINCKIQFIHLENHDNGSDKSIAKIVERINSPSSDKISIAPYLYIVEEQKDIFMEEILFHEIMHLFSIGDCPKTNSSNLFLHRSGLDQYHIYTTEKVVRINRCSFLNELLNDSVAAFLYEKLIQKPYHGNSMFSCLQFHDFLIRQLENKNFTKEELIKSYFSHYDKFLEEILLANSVENFNRLDDIIYKNYVQKKSLLSILT